ncbi:hypothetical protein FJ366_00950 [Candidatus Dependentiae bacterium]|nr:hypothetical protein [Candidatus Dependentiae bacterium]
MNEPYNNMYKLALCGKFSKFTQIYLTSSKSTIEELKLNKICSNLATDYNLCGYGLACYLNLINESTYWHSLIFFMLQFDIQYLAGAYQAALAHAFRNIELFPNIEVFYGDAFFVGFSPDGELPDNELFEIAQIVLSQWPNNQAAKIVFDKEKDNPPTITVAEIIKQAIQQDKHAAFRDLVLRGRYIETRQLFLLLSEIEMQTILLEIATTLGNICAYDYGWFLMREMGENSQRHSFMAKTAEESFKCERNGIRKDPKGLKELVFFHTYRAAELESYNIELQEALLALYEPGNESFDIEETQLLAQQVLKNKPECEQAIRVLELLNKKIDRI